MLLLSLALLARSGELVEATRRGAIDSVRVLLAVGGDADAPDENGVYPLDFAALAASGGAEMTRLLLDYKASVNVLCGGSTPLDLAVARGHADTARLLIDNGADVRRVYPSGRTPLHIAASNGHVEVAGLLIDRGADLNARDGGGMSALDMALARNLPDVVNLLMDAGATLGGTPLHTAVRTNRVALVKALLPHAGEALDPLLEEAVRRRFSEIVDVLLEAGASPTAGLHEAAVRGVDGMIPLFIEKGADVNSLGDFGMTALQDAALAGHLEAVRSLVEHGARVNAGDKDSGATALYMAATMGREDVVALLLAKGADPNVGPSPLRAAISGGFDRIAEMLRPRMKAK